MLLFRGTMKRLARRQLPKMENKLRDAPARARTGRARTVIAITFSFQAYQFKGKIASK